MLAELPSMWIEFESLIELKSRLFSSLFFFLGFSEALDVSFCEMFFLFKLGPRGECSDSIRGLVGCYFGDSGNLLFMIPGLPPF